MRCQEDVPAPAHLADAHRCWLLGFAEFRIDLAQCPFIADVHNFPNFGGLLRRLAMHSILLAAIAVAAFSATMAINMTDAS
jgi:hypothetical protein